VTNIVHTETVTYEYDKAGRMISKTTVNTETEPTRGPDAEIKKVAVEPKWASPYWQGQWYHYRNPYSYPYPVISSGASVTFNKTPAKVFDLNNARSRRMADGYL